VSLSLCGEIEEADKKGTTEAQRRGGRIADFRMLKAEVRTQA